MCRWCPENFFHEMGASASVSGEILPLGAMDRALYVMGVPAG